MIDADLALSLKRIAVALVPALLGIILHEVAHGYVADRRGDPTARLNGRLTLNPLPHIDPMGLLVFVLTSISGLFVFGWAKPVPVDPRNLRNPHKDMMYVALSGPLTNLALAIIFAVLLRLLVGFMPPAMWEGNATYVFFFLMLKVGIVINCSLCWLNILPIPPLDGSKVLAYFLPPRLAWQYMSAGRYGFIILLVLLGTGVLGYILGPLVFGTNDILLALVGLA